jgi:zinc transporter ZupT
MERSKEKDSRRQGKLCENCARALGSLTAFFIRDFKHSYLCFLMGFSAGVMIQISFMELLFSSVIETGFLTANIAFFVGIATIAAIEFLIRARVCQSAKHGLWKKKLLETSSKLSFLPVLFLIFSAVSLAF